MAIEFRLPDLGEGITDADVLKVLVAEGDTVSLEQPLLEIETEKATLDVPSSVTGRVTAVHIKPGDTVAVGQVLFTVEESGSESGAASRRTPASQPAQASSAPAAAPAPASAPQSEPATPSEQPQPSRSGVAEAEPAPEAPEAGEPRDEAPEPSVEPETARAAPAPPGSRGAEEPPVFASPSVRRFAREIGLEVRDVRGSGPGGRISEDDVKRHARDATAAPAAASTAAQSSTAAAGLEAPPLPDFEQYGQIERQPLSRFRRTVARNMAVSWSQIPHVTLHRRVDVTELESLRQRYKQRAADAGGNLTVTVILLKIVAAALKAHPRMNASLDLVNNELILKRYYDIGVAVDTERGLAVPVVRGVDDKNIVELSVELSDIAERARNGDLTVEEMRGGTFTLTNLGGMGVGEFTPIINYPEVAVLGVGRAEQAPAWIDGKWEPRLQMPLSLVHDHRVIDGADGARFLTWIAEAIGEPLLIALEG